jgi:GT2 family glycosyltransferase
MLQKKVSVIVVSYNVQYFLELCLDSVIRAVRNIPAEIIVIDNNSSDDSCTLVRERFKEVTLIANKDNAGFSRANNQGLAIATGEYIHFLNPDTVLPEDFYQKTIAFLDEYEDTGCLGPRLADGRGQYAPDSKKSFPSFWTSVFKVAGLSRLFPNSTFFNRYYAAQVGEKETAEVDILSGCCLIVRRTAMEAAGGGFDESYFMYCEDVDLCHRVRQAGYKNIYYPETTIIHYKGESTRKLSYRYMKIFYDAHALFVKKYYPKRLGTIYITALRMVLALRNFLNWGRYLFSLFKMFLLDGILLTLVTLLVRDFWFDNVARLEVYDAKIILKTFPFFLTIWLLSLFLNGAYDKPFSLFKAGRGMVLGTIIVLAGYALFPLEYRYSRGVVLFSGMTGAIVLLLVRWLLSLLNWIKLVPRGKVDYKAAIVSDEQHFTDINTVLDKTHYNLEVIGRVATGAPGPKVLGTVADLPYIQEIYRVNELIFSAGSLSYSDIISNMERCAPNAFYKIHVQQSEALVGSNNSKHHADEFSLSRRYRIGAADSRRNKRIVDIFTAVLLLLFYPVAVLRVNNKAGLGRNILQVLTGSKTWIGYTGSVAAEHQLPLSKPAILPPYPLNKNYTPDKFNYAQLAYQYAVNYSALDDLRLLWINFRFSGEKN